VGLAPYLVGAAFAAGAAAQRQALVDAWLSQAPATTVHLAADAERIGPPAWSWAREQLAAAHGGAARASLTLALIDGRLDARPGIALAPGEYLRAELAIGGTIVRATCDFNGRETWLVPTDAANSPIYRQLLAWLDLGAARRSPAWFDTGALVGLIGTGFETDAPTGLWLTIGAAECGELIATIEPTAAGSRLAARSGGGLLLPAALLWLAHHHGGAPTEQPEQRWMRLAFAARDSRRDEAALQLGRFASAQGERCLRALLHLDDGTQLRAAESLVRRGAIDSLPLLARLTRTTDLDTRVIAGAAIASLWERADAPTRTGLRSQADAELRALLANLERPRVAGLHGAESSGDATVPMSPTRRALAATLLFTAGLLAILLARHRRKNSSVL
jgi:hypothetical protein